MCYLELTRGRARGPRGGKRGRPIVGSGGYRGRGHHGRTRRRREPPRARTRPGRESGGGPGLQGRQPLGQTGVPPNTFFFTTIPLQAQPHRQHDTAMKAGCREAPHGKRQTPRARSQSRSHRKRAHTAHGREARAHGRRHHARRAGSIRRLIANGARPPLRPKDEGSIKGWTPRPGQHPGQPQAAPRPPRAHTAQGQVPRQRKSFLSTRLCCMLYSVTPLRSLVTHILYKDAHGLTSSF